MVEKGYLVRFVYSHPSLCSLCLQWQGLCFPSWYGRGERNTFTKKNLYSALRKVTGGQRAPLTSSISQLLSAQNNHYTKVAYFGVEYSDPLQRWFRNVICDIWARAMNVIWYKIDELDFTLLWANKMKPLLWFSGKTTGTAQREGIKRLIHKEMLNSWSCCSRSIASKDPQKFQENYWLASNKFNFQLIRLVQFLLVLFRWLLHTHGKSMIRKWAPIREDVF